MLYSKCSISSGISGDKITEDNTVGIVQTAIAHFWGFNGVGMHFALFVAAILYLIAVKKAGEDKPRTILGGYSMLFAVLYLVTQICIFVFHLDISHGQLLIKTCHMV